MNTPKKGRPFVIVAGAVVLLGAASLVPWGDLSDNFLKSFNLLADIFPGSIKATAEEVIDPELASALAETDDNVAVTVMDKAGKSSAQDGSVKRDPSALSLMEVAEPKSRVNNRDGSTVIIEDYTIDGAGLANLRRALANSSTRTARIAVIGDSYIEGDILTMNLREDLQDRYGGAGVGYMPASSALTGFRQTVKQKCTGWTQHEIRHDMRESMKILSGEYYTAGNGASTTYSGVSKLGHLASWNRTLVLVNAPDGGSVTVTTDGASNTLTLQPEDKVQALTVPGNTSTANVTATAGVEVLGVYLDNTTGVAVDNMSLRGNSGQTHRRLSVDRAAQMRPYVDYDLIIVEYGINALSSQQSNNSGYKKLMKQTISRLRECYPNADILVMGIGDRGQKLGSEIKSVPTSANMVTAQRDAARETGVLFWDTRDAMGGEDAVVEWRDKGLINPDYIHLNQKGGKVLADRLMTAIVKAI